MNLVGSGFAYEMSLVSPEFDLMLLAALRNDRSVIPAAATGITHRLCSSVLRAASACCPGHCNLNTSRASDASTRT